MNSSPLIALVGVLLLISVGVWLALKDRRRSREIDSVAHQPVPDISRQDVENVVYRDFTTVPPKDVFSILQRYNNARWESVTFRVQMAALKLANGNLESLRSHIAAANQDYRDVLVAAEYPEYGKKMSGVGQLSAEERRRIIDADWKQYQDWLQS